MKIKKLLLIFAFLLDLSACSQGPVFTAEAPSTLTPFLLLDGVTLSATPAPLPTSTPSMVPPADSSLPPIPIPTFLPVTEMASDFSPVLYGKKYDANTFFILLGGWQGDNWLTPDVAATYFGNLSGWEYDVYPLAKEKFQIHGDRLEFSPPHKIYTIGTEINVDEAGMVGVAKGWPVLQRDVRELSPDNETYRQIVLDWLMAQGLSEPELSALRVFRVDLEGDGVDEVFISATHLENQHGTKPGDYSVILMRKVQGNGVTSLLVVGDVYHLEEMTMPREYSFGNFLDLNGDGVLEVIVDIRRWDGDGAVIYQIDGQNITQLPCDIGWACNGL